MKGSILHYPEQKLRFQNRNTVLSLTRFYVIFLLWSSVGTLYKGTKICLEQKRV